MVSTQQTCWRLWLYNGSENKGGEKNFSLNESAQHEHMNYENINDHNVNLCLGNQKENDFKSDMGI